MGSKRGQKFANSNGKRDGIGFGLLGENAESWGIFRWRAVMACSRPYPGTEQIQDVLCAGQSLVAEPDFSVPDFHGCLSPQ